MDPFTLWLRVALLLLPISAFAPNQPVAPLLKQYAEQIETLKPIAPETSDLTLLRFCLSTDDPKEALETSLQFRTSERGQAICQAASKAVELATKNGIAWNNLPVLDNAPNGAAISQYITPSNCITTTSSTGDLVYCIRAGAIDDTALMEQTDIESLVDFFLYIKEVHSIVANQRSADKLISVITCNDLSGIKLVGGSADFRNALSESSKLAATVYPKSLAGPTLLLNLPALLSALVKLFTPLFPEAVKARLKFQQGPLKKVKDLQTIASSSESKDRVEFLSDLDALIY